MKIAVIGAGISGNVAAYHLAKEHDVTLFEANDYVGGHTHTHDIIWEGKHHAVDTGFIVFNEKTYPEFISLLDELGVQSSPTEMSFSVKNELTQLEYNGHSLNTLFAQRRNLVSPSFYKMIADILRFNRRAPESLLTEEADLSLGDYLRVGNYSRAFVDQYIIPMGAAIWSTDAQRLQKFPARFFIRFFLNHGLLNVSDRPRWFVINGGSRKYVEPLTRAFKEGIRLRSAVKSISRVSNGVEIKTQNQKTEIFDNVFVATHSDQALGMLAQPTKTEREVLGAIRYQENEAVLHTDETILPRRKLAWAAWNYHILPTEQNRVALTYNMNILQGLTAPVQFCVTLNNTRNIDKRKIIKTISYDHPVFTAESMAAQLRQRDINGNDKIYYCGAYWRNGFHEDGVVSALSAVKHFEEDQRDAQLHLRRTG